MRIRSIKPEFWTSESMGRVSREARLFFVGLWSLADDSGRTRAASRMLASLLYPYDDDARAHVDDWLAELEREQCIRRYEVGGNHYLEVCNWLSHQKIDRPSPSKLPAPPEALASPREPSRALVLGTGNREQGTGNGNTPNPPKGAVVPDIIEDKAPEDTAQTAGELPESWAKLVDPGKIVAYVRKLTTAEPSSAQLACWKAAMVELHRRNADPEAIGRALNAFLDADPKFRGAVPDARRIKAEWFLGLVTKYGAKGR